LTTTANYDRNHSAIPALPAYSITVHGLVKHSLTLTVDDLARLEQHSVVACLVCAGNRRHTMREIKNVQGIEWYDGAVQNCLWRGPLLSDVLRLAGLDTESGHVECIAVSEPCEDTSVYGGSVPLTRVLDSDAKCILALSMNGESLSAERGCPVRAVFPGIIGARWVKWIEQIVVRSDESANFYQQHDYKQLPPQAVDKKTSEPFWAVTRPMMDVPINSVIGIARKDDGGHLVSGYAVPHGSDGPIVKVEVSFDGQNWTEADLDFGGFIDTRWSWCLWTARVEVTGKTCYSRATDASGNVQPKECPWNIRGVGYNAWGQFPIEDS
jgi:sulfite oxidase